MNNHNNDPNTERQEALPNQENEQQAEREPSQADTEWREGREPTRADAERSEPTRADTECSEGREPTRAELNAELVAIAQTEYQFGFVTEVESFTLEAGLNEEIITKISRLKNEPDWLLEFRLNAYRTWLTMPQPDWGHLKMNPIDFQAISYYSAPESFQKNKPKSLDEVDPKILETYEKLGIPLYERAILAGVENADMGEHGGLNVPKENSNIAVDAVFDSVSVGTSFRERLKKDGIIFCSFSDAVQEHPELVQKYLGTVVRPDDNFFSALNSAVFTDGSFCFIPKGVRCPMELSTYFRINAANTGQFERTLIVAEEGGYASYLEGCTAPRRNESQLHAAVVEIITFDDAEIKYSTVQNWYPGDEQGVGGVYNLVTKRGLCKGKRSKISWTQVETGSAVTWKYPSVILQGDDSVGEFFSVAVTRDYQQADTGSKMVHLGKNTKSTIISKGIALGHAQNTYRGLVKMVPKAENARNFSQCDSLLIGGDCGAHTFPYLMVQNPTAKIEHEATTSKIGEDQIFYCLQRGISEADAVNLIVHGFCDDVYKKLPVEFTVEARRLIELKLEGSVG